MEVLDPDRSRAVALGREIAHGHGTVVALDHHRAERLFVGVGSGAGGPGDLNILLHHEPVEDDLQETRVGDFDALGVEAWRAELDFQVLPQAGGAAGVGLRGVAFIAFASNAARRIPALVDAAAVGEGRHLHARAVENLHLIPALKIDAGIGLGPEQEIQLEVEVTVLPRGEQLIVFPAFDGIADDNARANQRRVGPVATQVARPAAGEPPVVGHRPERGQRIERHRLQGEERFSARQ